MALEEVKTQARLVDGLTVDIQARDHVVRIDEPKAAGGADEGMTPVEALLGSLGSCKVIVAQLLAESCEIKLNNISIEHAGEIDPDGLAGTNPEAKIGFSKITTIYDIDADNTQEEIEKFIEIIESTCPVRDTIVNAPEWAVQTK